MEGFEYSKTDYLPLEVTRSSCELPSPVWLKFEGSTLWKKVRKRIQKIEKEHKTLRREERRRDK